MRLYPFIVAPALAALGCRGAPEIAAAPSKHTPARVDSKEVNANYWQVGECYLAGQPTEKGFEEAKAKGMKTVIDLRAAGEARGFDEKKLVESLGLEYVNVPVSPGAINDATVEQFLAALKASQKPLMIHCGSASRVWGLWAIHLALDEGVPIDEALALAEKSGLRSSELKAFAKSYVEKRKK